MAVAMVVVVVAVYKSSSMLIELDEDVLDGESLETEHVRHVALAARF